MLTRAVEKEVLISFKVLTLLKVIPLNFSLRDGMFRVSKSRVRNAFIIFQNLLLFFSPAHAIYILYYLYSNEAGLYHLSNQILTVCSVFSATVFLSDWSLNRHELVLLANRLIVFNAKHDARSKEGAKYADPLDINTFMCYLPPFYSLMVVAMYLFVVSLEFSENPFNWIGLLPAEYQNNWTLTAIVLLHLLISSTRSLCWSFTFLFQGYCYTTICYWMNRIGGEVPRDYGELDKRIELYRELQLIIRQFNERMTVTIMNTKLGSTSCGIGSLFILIKFGRDLTTSQYIFPFWLIFACLVWPPLLYGRVYKVHTFSVKLKRQATLGINMIRSVEERRELRQKILSLSENNIRCSSYYFLDRTFTPLFVSHAVETTISLLLMN